MPKHRFHNSWCLLAAKAQNSVFDLKRVYVPSKFDSLMLNLQSEAPAGNFYANGVNSGIMGHWIRTEVPR